MKTIGVDSMTILSSVDGKCLEDSAALLDNCDGWME